MSIQLKGIEELQASLAGLGSNIAKELGIITWKTGKKCESIVAKRIYAELNTTQKVIKANISIKRGKTRATVSLAKSNRISLKEFKPRQNKVGVTAKVSRSKGAKMIPSAFQGPKPGTIKTSWKGNAFKRVGKSRLPIVKLKGPSPWGVFVKNDMLPITVEETQVELQKQLRERIRWNNLKRSKGL